MIKIKVNILRTTKKILKTGFATSFPLSSSIKGNEKPVCCTFILKSPKNSQKHFLLIIQQVNTQYLLHIVQSPVKVQRLK